MNNINLMPFAYGWAVLTAVVIALIVYRKLVARAEDDTLHVQGNMVSKQVVVSQKLDQIDRWGKLLTIVAILYGVVVAAAFAYQNFVEASMNPLR
jgi:ABC-type iron transport system FetAB permease component